MGFSPLLNLLLLILVPVALGNVYSCGGFVRSSSPIDYSQLKVKLLTVEGHLKNEEDVNPSNGYFMIPVYSKGQYSLKVSSPAGYYFEPDTIPLKIDGSTDPCSQNEDIIFNLSGFSIQGVVDGAGEGLSLVLTQNGKQVDSTVTTDGGKYEMKAPTGKYEVSTGPGASECISRGKTAVEVSTSPVVVTPNLRISGYQLNIETSTVKGAAFKNAEVQFYSTAQIDLPNIKCQKVSNIAAIPASHSYQCILGKTNSIGKLDVACVPTGEYYIKASYEHITFAPNAQKVSIGQATSDVKIVAESASSKVRVTAKGKGLPNVDVLQNSKSIGKTDSDGYVVVKNLKEGEKTILTANAKNTHFDTVTLNIKFPKVEIDDVKVTKFEICGTVEKSESGKIEGLTVTRKEDKKSLEIQPKPDGSFCQAVSPGLFTIEATDKASTLTPKKLDIDVTDKPSVDLRFTHYKTDATVKTSCIGECSPLAVSLYLPGNTLVRTLRGSDEFVFENIGPGTYTVRLEDGGRGCWERPALEMIVEQSKAKPSVQFKQIGFSAPIQLSHPANIKWANKDAKNLHGETETDGGDFLSICVPKSGNYLFELESCYRFENQQFELTVPFDGIHKEKAVAARISGNVDFEGTKTSGVVVKVKSSAGEREVTVSTDGKFVFDEPLSTSGESLQFVPTSTVRLFEPTSKTITVSGKCEDNAASFKSFLGIFIDGTIKPAVENVQIHAVLRSDPSVTITTTSSSAGSYKIGPIKRVEDYDISAILDGYKFIPSSKAGNFESVKLSQLSIKIVDEATNEPLEGVLLSLVGGKGAGSDFRANNILDNTAQKNFVALAPGEYFVRAILQEYKFQPSTSTIIVKEGQHENVILKGKRVAYSAFGKLREMSGAPVKDVIVEAVSTGCDSHQSEFTTTQDGVFRLRGLLPDCKYSVYAKSYADGSAAPHSFPGQFTIDMTLEDVKGLEFIATTVDKTTDMIIEIDMQELRDIQSVRLTIQKGHEQIQSASIVFPQNLFYLTHLERDGSEYSVRVEAEKPPHAFAAKTVIVQADTAIRVVRVPLTSSKKAGEVDISIGSLLSMPFFICLGLVFFNQSRVIELVQTFGEFVAYMLAKEDNQRKRK